MRSIKIFIILIILVNLTLQGDQSFKELCEAKGGDYIPQTGQSYLPNQCVVTLTLNAENDKDAEYHCKRWGIWALHDSKSTPGKYAQCTYHEIYTCRPGYIQIRGMCYKWHNSLMSYGTAKRTCDQDGSEVLRMYDELGELFDDNIDDLSIYHLQPDENLNSAPRFFGGSGPNYVALFSHAVHYRAGYNTIHRFESDQKAYTICQYRPEETFYSFSLSVKKLGNAYHESMVTGDTVIWRTSSVYSRTFYMYYSKDSKAKEYLCQNSMSSILGTKEGTFANTNKHLTSSLTQKMKDSFVVAYAPIEYCYMDYLFHYFRPKEKNSVVACKYQPPLDNSEYNGDFRQSPNGDYEDNVWQYLYLPQVTSGYNIVTRRFTHMAPVLCTLGANG